MVTVRKASWWGECLRALRSDPLADVAARFGADAAVLCEGLAAESAGAPAERAVWWPEALRMLEKASIREIARTFHTEPRRIRRALARLNLRVGGRDVVEDAGVPQLAGLRDMLGREPDGVVAHMAGVIPEAVQGERRRLRIPAYVQRRRVRLSREDEVWIRGPKRGRRAKVHVEENLQVVRRPTRTDENAHRPSGWGVGHADPKPRVTGEFVARPPRLDRDFFRSQGPDELERLLQPVRQRDGRQRIVRGEPARPAESEPVARPTVAIDRRAVARAGSSSPDVRASRGPAAPAREPRPQLPKGLSRSSAGDVLLAGIEARPAAVPAKDEWLVYVPGNDTPLRVRAPDIVQAIAAAALIVPPDLLRLASVWRADET